MEIFVHRAPAGFMTFGMEGIEELGEHLTEYGPLDDDSEVMVEITAPWSFVKQLLTNPVFDGQHVWFDLRSEKESRSSKDG